MQNKGKKALIIILIIALIVVAGVGAFLLHRFTPSDQTMKLTDYFKLSAEDDVATIVDGAYVEPEEGGAAFAKVVNGKVYLNVTFLKKNLDNGYVYDQSEGILRYVTDQDVITVNKDVAEYQVNRDKASFDETILMEEDGVAYISADFAKLYTDFTYELKEDPNRILVEKAGSSKTVATVKKKEAARRYGGVKSAILTYVEKDDQVTIVEDYGSWSLVLTRDGVLGCVRNSRLSDEKKVEVKATLPERNYQHKLLDQKIVLGWHQVTNTTANKYLSSVLSQAQGMNVISPTWFAMSDNQGGIQDLGSTDYVATCHAANIQVWGLVNNFDVAGVDTTAVLNTTSSRDTLVNNLIAAAITYNLDGINVDIESLKNEAADGYIEFIKELSIKCEKNDIILSVDNYVPSAHTGVYDRATQANYVDYNIVMAYDEHYAGDEEAGSVSSYNFVKKGIKDTLEVMPKEQVIMGLPCYTRVWKTDASGKVTSEVLEMKNQDQYLADNGMTAKLDDETKQNYAETTDDNGNKVQVWLEDTDSITKKLEIYKKNDLAGVAYWRLGNETESIWSATSEVVK